MNDPVVLREFGSRADAEIVRELLLASGIQAAVASDDWGAMDPALAFTQGVRLLVDRADQAEAERILTAREKAG